MPKNWLKTIKLHSNKAGVRNMHIHAYGEVVMMDVKGCLETRFSALKHLNTIHSNRISGTWRVYG